MIQRPSGNIQTSILISTEFYDLCKQHHIKFTEALRVGISIMLAERDVIEYDNKLNIHRKMKLYQAQVTELLQKIEELQKLNNGTNQ